MITLKYTRVVQGRIRIAEGSLVGSGAVLSLFHDPRTVLAAKIESHRQFVCVGSLSVGLLLGRERDLVLQVLESKPVSPYSLITPFRYYSFNISTR